ncbi:MAG: small subunit ribosomal protein S1 [Chlamydiales bacterium]|jgi:small subunit ribosomal protein S1
MTSRDAHPTSDHGAHTLRVWRGAIVGQDGDDVFVELGPRMQGVISLRAFEDAPEIGDCHDFTLRGQEDQLWVLARVGTKSMRSWEDLEVGSLVAARALRSTRDGLQLKIGPLHAFMPRSHTGAARGEAIEPLVGKTLTCEVLEVDPERQRVLLSRRLVLKREREQGAEGGTLRPGQVIQGSVSRIEDYGAFVRFGRGHEGLVHVSNISTERIAHPADVLRVGQSVEARVLYIKRSGKRIALGIKQMQESPWARLEKELHEDQIVQGTVTRFLDFGVLVTIRPGVEGLLHERESGLAGKRLRDVLRKGSQLSVRVCDLDCEEERLSLSLLHRDGARIRTNEAADASSFHDWEGEHEDTEGSGTNLGQLLRRALEQ